MVIQHNIMAMNANHVFNLTNTNQKKFTEKLSLGYKTNRSADDAAEPAITDTDMAAKGIKGHPNMEGLLKKPLHIDVIT